MKADELWDKYAAHRGNGYPTMDKPDFLAALAEYGGHFKSEAVKVCKGKRYMTVDMSDKCGFAKVDAMRYAANDCAAAIEKLEIK